MNEPDNVNGFRDVRKQPLLVVGVERRYIRLDCNPRNLCILVESYTKRSVGNHRVTVREEVYESEVVAGTKEIVIT